MIYEAERAEIAKMFGVGITTITYVVNSVSWKHVKEEVNGWTTCILQVR